MTAKLDKLKARRKGNQDFLTKLSHESRALLDEGEITERGRRRQKVIQGQLEEKAALLAGLDEQIVELSDIGEIETDIMESSKIACSITELNEEIQNRLEKPAPSRKEEQMLLLRTECVSQLRDNTPQTDTTLRKMKTGLRPEKVIH